MYIYKAFCPILYAVTALYIVSTSSLQSISVVYNFKIAQITRRPIVEHKPESPHMFGTLLYNWFQKTYCNNIRENYTGALFTYIHNFSHSTYLKTDFAFGNVHQTRDNVETVNKVETDDLLITAGHCFIHTPKNHVTISGLLGIPTHPVYTLQRSFLGYGQVGTGIQLDGLHSFHPKIDALWGVRINHFYARCAQDKEKKFSKFNAGNIGDILLALKSDITKIHSLEAGYAGRWGFGATVAPSIEQGERFSYQKNSFYGVYGYTFKTTYTAQKILAALFYGFDSRSKQFGYKDIIVAWVSWAINF